MSELDKILADEQLFKLIEFDLSLRYPKTTKTGRNSTPVEVIFRILVIKHLRGLSYEKVIFNVNESLTLRQFCRIYCHPIPDKSTLIRWSNQINQKTLEKFNQRLTAYATQLQITQGKKLRTDGTVVATNIHFPFSFLKRCFGLERCFYRGESGFSRWVGWGIIAHNLTIITRSLIKNESQKNQKHRN